MPRSKAKEREIDLDFISKKVSKSVEKAKEERLERKAQAVKEGATLEVNLFPKQAKAFEYLQDRRTNEVLYGGGARGGKTRLGVTWILLECVAKPGSAWLIGRAELKKLKQTTLLEFFTVAAELGITEESYNYNVQESIIKFSNGSMVFLVDMSYKPSDPNYDSLGSLSLTGAFIDECQEVQYKAINVLRGRFSLLRKFGWETIPKLLVTCNPAKNWIYTEFYKPWREKRLEQGREFIPALVQDNPTVPQSYIDFLKKSDRVTVERLLNGNFEYDDDPNLLFSTDDVQGMFRDVEKAQRNGQRYVSVDVARYGRDKTVVCLWDGLLLEKIWQISGKNTEEVSDFVRDLCGQWHVPLEHVVVDEDGVGGGVVDKLECVGFVNNSAPRSPYGSKVRSWLKRNYANLKTQCYCLFNEYARNGLVKVKVDGKEKESLIEELGFIRFKEIDNDQKLQLESKVDMKDRLGRSPDLADAMMFRFLFEIIHMPIVEDDATKQPKPVEHLITPYGKIRVDDMDIDEYFFSLDYKPNKEPKLSPY